MGSELSSSLKKEVKSHDLWVLQENKALLNNFQACGESVLFTSISIGQDQNLQKTQTNTRPLKAWIHEILNNVLIAFPFTC